MGIFGRKAGSRAEAAGAAEVFTAPERERVEALWRLTALPRAEFEATYGAMLGGFWRYAAGARGEPWAALRRETLAGELIWDDDPPPRANAGLVGKGR